MFEDCLYRGYDLSLSRCLYVGFGSNVIQDWCSRFWV